MKLLIFTKEEGPETRSAMERGQQISTEGYEVEYLSEESAECTQKAELYDIYSYPSFVVIREDGSEVECWRGQVPLRDDILNFLNR